MKIINVFIVVALALTASSMPVVASSWKRIKYNELNLYYLEYSKSEIELVKVKAKKHIQSLKDTYKIDIKTLNIYLFPDRSEFDKALSNAKKIENFKSKDWLVGSTTRNGDILVLSTKKWTYHKARDLSALLKHEMIHSFQNKELKRRYKKTIYDLNEIRWLSEGISSYIAGQYSYLYKDTSRKLSNIDRKYLDVNDFIYRSSWNLYPISSFIVNYIKEKYGNKKIKELLTLPSMIDVYRSLEVSNLKFLEDLSKYSKAYKKKK